MKALSVAVAIAVALAWCFVGEPAFAQGRGIGKEVSAAAKTGVHGEVLAAQVKQFQGAHGIGQCKGGGKAVPPAVKGADVKGGKPVPPAVKGADVKGGKAVPPAVKGADVKGGKAVPPAVKGADVKGGKGAPPAGKGNRF
jgi:hypothetical protein